MQDPVEAGARLGQEFSTAVVMFHEAVGRRLGLSAVDQRALGVIARTGPLSAGQIAEATGLTPGAVTGLVDRLERAGYVTRTTDPGDRRRSLVAARNEQDHDLPAVFAELGRDLWTVLSRYDEHELQVITDYLTRTIEVMRRQTRRLSDEDTHR